MKKGYGMLIIAILSLILHNEEASAINRTQDEAALWWCRECQLAYPMTTKVCLNKNCVLYRKAPK